MGASIKYKARVLQRPVKLKLIIINSAHKSLKWGFYSAKLLGIVSAVLGSIFTAEIVQQDAPGVYSKPERKPLDNYLIK